MDWIYFPTYAITSSILWVLGLIMIYLGTKNKTLRIAGIVLFFAGIIVIISFISILWYHLERPPLRTLGETRLLYVFFLPVIGIIFYLRWGYKWFLSYALMMTFVFVIINLNHPETYDKTLMPALQSPWFVPHVVVYILGYALLGVSTLVSVYGLYKHYFGTLEARIILLADNLVYLGFSFLTLGLLFGALWAKQAWGHYWTWDPKETWAFITWMFYLVYIHYRFRHPSEHKRAMTILAVSFAILLICWFGVNYLPSAQNSVHIYSD